MSNVTTLTSQPKSSREVTLEAEQRRVEATKIIAVLMMSFREGNASKDVAEAYAAALSDLAVSEIAEVANRFARGQVPGRNNAFPPSAAELHAEADRLRRDRERHERIMTRGTEY